MLCFLKLMSSWSRLRVGKSLIASSFSLFFSTFLSTFSIFLITSPLFLSRFLRSILACFLSILRFLLLLLSILSLWLNFWFLFSFLDTHSHLFKLSVHSLFLSFSILLPSCFSLISQLLLSDLFLLHLVNGFNQHTLILKQVTL